MLYVTFLLYYISLNSGQHPERIKRFFYRNLREITFRLMKISANELDSGTNYLR